MRLDKLLKEISFEIIQGSVDKEIKNLCWDSRKAEGDCLFICVKNKNVDRHDFVLEAIRNGAIALIVEHDIGEVSKEVTIIKVTDSKKVMAIIANKYYGEPSKNFNLIGITGTNGKTSVSYFISQVLESIGRRVGLIGTIENSIAGNKLNAEKLNPTTPDSIELQASFSEMLRAGATDVVMEVTSSGLAQERVYRSDFNIGVFTNLTQDHLEEHGTMENYRNEKMKLFKMCKNGVINADDHTSDYIREQAACNIITYGIESDADFKAFNIKHYLEGVSFSISYKGVIKDVFIKVPGKFTVYNTLATIGACFLSGITLDEIVFGLSKIQGVPGRFEVVPNDKGVLVIVDYAHSPDSLENLLTSVREISKGNIITVFGCGGNRDKTKRPIMGEIAGKLSDFCVITSDNPRLEIPSLIIEDIEQGVIKTACSYIKNANRKDAIFIALNKAKAGDVIIIAGKGHEKYQIVGKEFYHFDDKEIVQEYFNA